MRLQSTSNSTCTRISEKHKLTQTRGAHQMCSPQRNQTMSEPQQRPNLMQNATVAVQVQDRYGVQLTFTWQPGDLGDNPWKTLQDISINLINSGCRPIAPFKYDLTPEGDPICPRHRVAMTKREKQGDVWYSHQVTTANNEQLFCRGYASKSGPGWYVKDLA